MLTDRQIADDATLPFSALNLGRVGATPAGDGEAAGSDPACSRPLRIVIYGLNLWPELTGIGRYTGDMAAWLAEQGHKVTVVTAYPYYPHWKLQEGYPVWRWSKEVWRGVTIYRCPLWVPRVPSAKARLLHLLSFVLTSAPAVLVAALRQKPDLIFVVEPTTLCTLPALAVARLTGARTWLHVQDIEIGAAERLQMMSGWQSRVFAPIYGMVLRAFNKVTTLTGNMRTKLAEYGRPASTVELFPNWVDTDKFRPVDAANMRRELGLAPMDVCVLYAGNLGAKQAVESLLDVALLLEDEPRIRVVICGQGAMRDSIAARLPNHRNVVLLDPQPDDRFVELLSAANIHVLPQRRGITHYVMPSKLGPMLASTRPIVAQADHGCEVREALNGIGTVVPCEDPVALATALRRLASLPQEAPARTAAVQRLLHSLARTTVLLRMEQEARQLLAAPPPMRAVEVMP